MKKQLLVLTALMLSGVTLAGCGENSANTDSTTTSVEPVDTRPVVTLDAEEGSTLKLKGGEDGKFEAGSLVEFEVTVDDDLKELVGILLDDEVITGDHFTMPNHDVTLKTVLTTIGDGSLRNVTKFADDATLPSTFADVETLFAAASLVDGKFFKEGTIKSNYSSFDFAYEDLAAVANRNGGVMVKGVVKDGSGSDSTSPYFYQSGKYNDKYAYAIKGVQSTAYLTSNASYNVTPTIYSIVDEVKDKSTEVSKADAELLDSTPKFVSSISSKILGGYNLWDEDNAIVEAKLNSDKTEMEVNVSSFKSSYGSVYASAMNFIVDGDGFISNVIFLTGTYASADYDSEEKVIKEGAVASASSSLTYAATRDYKAVVDLPFDIDDFVMHDYNLSFLAKAAGSYSKTALAENVVEASSTLSYQIVGGDSMYNVIKPKLVGITEGFGTVASGATSVEITSIGDFELTFDNGLGELKTVAFKSTQPKGTKITFSLASNASIFAANGNELKVSVYPDLADQTVTLAVDDSKTGGVETTVAAKEGDANTFIVTPSATGSVYLKATAEDGTVTATLTLKAVEKPTAASAKAALVAKTVKFGGYGYDWNYFWINFNEDGTGALYVTESSSYTSEALAYSFTYSIDETTLAFTITMADHGTSTTWYGIKSFSYATETSINIEIEGAYYGAAKSYTKSGDVLTTRKDASAFE